MDITKDIEKIEINKKQTVKEKESMSDKYFEKYQAYFEPVVVTDTSCKILYKNASARSNILKLKVNNSIKKVLMPESLKKLQNTIIKGTDIIVDMNISAPFSCAMAIRDTVEVYSENSAKFKTEKIIVFIFFAAINLFQQDSYREKAETIISMYSEEISDTSKSITPGLNELSNMLDTFEKEGNKKNVMSVANKEHAKFVLKSIKKSTWLTDKFHAYIENSKIYYDDRKQIDREISDFFSRLNNNIARYVKSVGCEIKFNTEDELFVTKINEKDFFLINLVIIMIALRHSPRGIVNQKFYINNEIKSGVVRYDFTLSENFFDIFKNRLTPAYLNNRKGMTDYLDLQLVALIAKNNNAYLTIRSDAESSKIIFEITINGKSYKPGDDSGLRIRSNDYYMSENEMKSMFEKVFFDFPKKSE